VDAPLKSFPVARTARAAAKTGVLHPQQLEEMDAQVFRERIFVTVSTMRAAETMLRQL
jgi:hypothetical protein